MCTEIFQSKLAFPVGSSSAMRKYGGTKQVKWEVYTVSFSDVLHDHLWVSYKLYSASRECSRTKFRFHNHIDSMQTATGNDYAKLGYDKDHLPLPKNFSYDCNNDELAFRFYNCLTYRYTSLLRVYIW